MTYLLGIDAGTTSMKAALFNENGRMVVAATREYALITPSPDIAELDAETYWQAFKYCVSGVVQSSRIPAGEIAALAISSQGETFLALGRDMQPVHRAVVWLDNRSAAEAAEIRERFGAERIYHVTGDPDVVPTWASTKMLWFRRNEPEVFRQVDRFLFVEDFLIFRLTGELVGETALYCSSLLMDIHSGKWWDELLDFIGVSPRQLPALRQSGEIVGPITARAARELGLSDKTLVVTGGMDSACSSVGAGNVASGIATDTTGASLNLSVTTDKPLFDPKMRVPCQVHCVPGKYLLVPWCQTAGAVLKWFRDEFCSLEKTAAANQEKDCYDLLTEQAARVAPGSDGLIMLPHLAGALCPELNSRAKGVFFGVGLDTTRAHFIRAILESVAFMLRANLEVISEMGVSVERLISSGGGAKSTLWNQIKADVTGKQIVVLDSPEASCVGAAILAGHATGVFASIEEASRKLISPKECFHPHAGNRAVYERTYERYRGLYQQLAEFF